MMLLIAGAALLVVYLAVKSPDVNTAENREKLPPNDNLPMLGNVGNPSPAMSNGAPVASQVYRTAMAVNAGLVGNESAKFTATGKVRALNAKPGIFRPPTQTVAEMGKTLMTQAPPSLAGVALGTKGTPPIKL
jgi:hypothetical protein